MIGLIGSVSTAEHFGTVTRRIYSGYAWTSRNPVVTEHQWFVIFVHTCTRGGGKKRNERFASKTFTARFRVRCVIQNDKKIWYYFNLTTNSDRTSSATGHISATQWITRNIRRFKKDVGSAAEKEHFHRFIWLANWLCCYFICPCPRQTGYAYFPLFGAYGIRQSVLNNRNRSWRVKFHPMPTRPQNNTQPSSTKT